MADERRQYKRINAPVLCRPLGAALIQDKRHVQDISLGGVRVYSDDVHQLGEHLELELFLPSGQMLTLDTQVVWVDTLPKEGVARFEIGLRYVEVSPADLEHIQAVLKDS